MEITYESIRQLWATAVFEVEFANTTSVNAELSAIIKNKEKEFLAKPSSSSSTLLFNTFSQFRTEQMLFDWDFEAIKSIEVDIRKCARRYVKDNYSAFSTMHDVKAWANVHRLGDWHGTHSHFTGGNEIASGVYWVNIPEEMEKDESAGGRLILFDPRGFFFPERKKIILHPVSGKLVIFPSWLQHEVTPIKTQEPRISIAFDIIKNEKT